jgi:hypothetical protein
VIATTAYRTTSLSTTLQEQPLSGALDRAAQGLPVFPCRPDKKPRIKGWPTAATTDPEQIKAWWARWPNANVGIPTGERSGLLVLDVDLDKGGFESLEALTSSLPDTYTVRTGSGGAHFYFRYPPGSNIRNSASLLAPGVDIRGEGGYVVAPPSRTTAPYAVLSDVPLAAIPRTGCWSRLDRILAPPSPASEAPPAQKPHTLPSRERKPYPRAGVTTVLQGWQAVFGLAGTMTRTFFQPYQPSTIASVSRLYPPPRSAGSPAPCAGTRWASPRASPPPRYWRPWTSWRPIYGRGPGAAWAARATAT